MPRSPDVVVVLTSQWRAQATGYAGDPNARTPCLDALAAESIDCSQAVTPHPFGGFARAAFLTGVPCPENGIRDYYDALPVEARTLAHRFGKAGCGTAFFGKWGLYERDASAPVVGEAHARVVVPEARRGGFAHWEGFEGGFLLNDPLFHGTGFDGPTKLPGYQSDVIAERFARYWKTRDMKRPAFAVLSLDAPHPPYGDPASGIAPPEASSILLDAAVTDDPVARETARRELSGYYTHIEATDRAIGRVIDLLKSGGWENTVFVFTSLHGDMHGSHGLFRKGWPHEESIRVPFLLSYPARFPRPRRDPILASVMDLGPTLLSWIGGDAAGMVGRDLSKALALEQAAPEEQTISMPSAPPFAKQCPYAWTATRTLERTAVTPADAAPFEIRH